MLAGRTVTSYLGSLCLKAQLPLKPLRVAAPVRPHVSRRHLACAWLCGVVPALRQVATGGIVSFHQSSAWDGKCSTMCKMFCSFYNRMVSLGINRSKTSVVVAHGNIKHQIIEHNTTATAHLDIKKPFD